MKEEVRAAVDDSWRWFKRALEPLTTADMEVAGVCGEWSVKDILGHIATWEAQVTAALFDGAPGSVGADPDAFNAAERDRLAGLSVPEMVTRLDETHRALGRALEDAGEEVFAPGHVLRSEIDSGTVLHYEEHGNQVRSWFARWRREQRPG